MKMRRVFQSLAGCCNVNQLSAMGHRPIPENRTEKPL